MLFTSILASSALIATAVSRDITVSVGKKGEASNIEFIPNVIEAEVNDVVTFKFWPKNHSVVQAAFAKPCEPLNNGFWSGFVATQDTETAAPTTFQYTVTNASAPIWFYCSQGRHCQGGMVGVINPNNASGNTIEKFASAAQGVQMNMSPTSPPANATSSPSGTPSASGTAASSSPTGAAAGLAVNSNLAITGVLGMFAYLLL